MLFSLCPHTQKAQLQGLKEHSTSTAHVGGAYQNTTRKAWRSCVRWDNKDMKDSQHYGMSFDREWMTENMRETTVQAEKKY